MEACGMSCCGMFELDNLGDNQYWIDNEEGGTWNPQTCTYENEERRTRPQALRACKRELREELASIRPRGRMVLATTVPGMSIASEALRSLRFRVVRRFRNGNTGNRITLWMKYVR